MATIAPVHTRGSYYTSFAEVLRSRPDMVVLIVRATEETWTEPDPALQPSEDGKPGHPSPGPTMHWPPGFYESGAFEVVEVLHGDHPHDVINLFEMRDSVRWIEAGLDYVVFAFPDPDRPGGPTHAERHYRSAITPYRLWNGGLMDSVNPREEPELPSFFDLDELIELLDDWC